MATATADKPTTSKPDAPEASTAPQDIHRWAKHVHVGDGATDCPDNGAACEDPRHLHIWLRLPNPFVRDDIRERAMAARARALRQLRDPDSSTAEVLEGELEDLRYDAERAGDTEKLLDRVVDKDWGERHLRAMRDASVEEDFQHIEADRERFAELDDMDAGERPAEEHAELDKHIRDYGKRVEELVKESEKPVRESLANHSVDELVEILRDEFRTAEGNRAFYDTWLRQCLLTGSYRPAAGNERPTQPAFDQVSDLAELTPEEANALRAVFVDLESAFHQGLGNG